MSYATEHALPGKKIKTKLTQADSEDMNKSQLAMSMGKNIEDVERKNAEKNNNPSGNKFGMKSSELSPHGEEPLRSGTSTFVVRDDEAQKLGNHSEFMIWLVQCGFVNDDTGKCTGSHNPFIYINLETHVFKHGVWGCRYTATVNDGPMTPEDFRTIYSIIQKYK